MQGHGRIIAPDFCVAHREANSGLSTLNRTKSILSIYHQQRQLQKQRGMCLNDTYPFCQQPLSGNCHSICFSKPVLWTATPTGSFLFGAGDRGRTGTVSLPQDFESSTSANSITPACDLTMLVYHNCPELSICKGKFFAKAKNNSTDSISPVLLYSNQLSDVDDLAHKLSACADSVRLVSVDVHCGGIACAYTADNVA